MKARPFFAALLLAMASPALAGTVPAVSLNAGPDTPPLSGEAVVATVDGEAITLEELLFRYATLPDQARSFYAAQPRGLELFLNDCVANVVVAREAAARGLGDTALARRLLDLKREEVLRDLYARSTVLAGIDESVLKARYEQEKARFDVAAVAAVRHIIVTPVRESPCPNDSGADAVGEQAARRKAERLRGELEGGTDFGALARQFSEDGSARLGGELGWVGKGVLVPELEEAAFSLPLGELSPVIHSKLGYHLVEVTGRRAGGRLSFELVRELLFQEVVGERAADLRRSASESLLKLKTEHRVEVFPDRVPW